MARRLNGRPRRAAVDTALAPTAAPERLSPQVLVTSEDAFPAFEREMLAAQSSVVMSFRIFEARTGLCSPEAQAVGRDWGELIAATLERGVSIDITISDFDPVTRPEMHRTSWQSLSDLAEAARRSRRPDLLSARVAMHPARVGLLPRLILWPFTLRLVRRHCDELNALAPASRAQTLARMPHFVPLVTERAGRLAPRLWPPPPLCPVTHHQKVAVFDDCSVYLGGLDLNERRRDTRLHDRPANRTWHDVQILLRGPIAAAAATHLREFRSVAEGGTATPPDGILRTVSARRSANLLLQSPRQRLTELAEAHYRAVPTARKLIYLESQFFRDRRLARLLARQASVAPGLELILVIPAAPEEVAFEGAQGLDARYGEYMQARCLDILRRGFGSRLYIATPAQPRHSDSAGRDAHLAAPIVYLHSKVSIFDGRSAVISSANLNGRSFRWDTEAGVRFDHPDDVAEIVDKVMGSWAPQEDRAAFLDPRTALERWRAHAESNACRPPMQRESFLLPYHDAPARRFGRNLPGVPEDVV